MKKYDFEYINREEPLAKFFDHVMKRLRHMRRICSPDTFRMEPDIADFQDKKFCDFCRYETWMHAVVERVCMWRDLICEYFSEYDGSWKYYAASRRLEAAREAGEEVESRSSAEDALAPFSILNELYFKEYTDVVQDALPEDLKGLCADLQSVSQVDMYDIFRKRLGNIEAFKKDKDGTLRPLTREEHDLDMALGMAEAEEDSKRIMGIVGGVLAVLGMLRECPPASDNTELLQMAYKASNELLEMDFEGLSKTTRSFIEKYGWEG